jgi:hypothetical protein
MLRTLGNIGGEGCPVGELRLEVRDFRDLGRWRWVLTGPGGGFLGDHEVRLEATCWQFEAFADLLGYLTWHVAPDRFDEDEARIVAEVGAWIGSEVLGPLAETLARARPATVRVIIPAEARALCFRPLELAHAGGRPLAGGGAAAGARPVQPARGRPAAEPAP